MNKEEKKEAKMREKDRKEREKLEKIRQKELIKDEKERRRNSFGYKLKTFFFTLVFAIILIIVAFFALKYYLNDKQDKLYNEEMSYYLEEGKNLLNNKEFEDAIKMFEKVEEESSLYDEAQKLINDAMDKYLEEYNNIADIYMSEGDFERAIELYNSLPDEMKNSSEVKEAIANVEVSRLQDKIKDITNSYDVLVTISEELNNSNISETAKNKINEFLNEKINSYNEEVKASVNSENYEEYLKEIEDLIEIYPENKILSDLLIFVNSFKPKSLLSLNYELENKTIEISGDKSKTVTDDKGKKYSNYILVNESDNLKENEITWNINGEYSKLSGKICLNDEIKDITSKGIKVTVLGDNKVLYKSKRVRKDTDPFNFNIDISDVKDLKIVLESDKGISYFIADAMISK